MSLLDDLNEIDVVPLELQKGTIELLTEYQRRTRLMIAARDEIIRLNKIIEQHENGPE
jgi:hypothetical protein